MVGLLQAPNEAAVMLEGLVGFPKDFARRYRELGYWKDTTLAQEYDVIFKKYGERVALIDGQRSFSYSELDKLSTNLELHLYQEGVRTLDRVVVQLPNVAEFVILYLALQKLGAIPIAALASHRYAEISQFVALSGATMCVVPNSSERFDYEQMVRRIQKENPKLRHCVTLRSSAGDWLSLADMIEKPASLPSNSLEGITVDPTDPAIFQLSGGTTGIPKLIPRTHNDYAYNSRIASEVCNVQADSVLLVVLPAAHNLPLACPGIQGFMFQGARSVLSDSTKPSHMCELIQTHGVTHLKVVPSLLIRLLNDPDTTRYDLSSLRIIQSGGQRLQPEVRRQAKQMIPSAFVQENFGMSEGLLMFVRLNDPPEVCLETVGRPVSPDDEVMLLDEQDQPVSFGEIGELCCRGPYTLRGYFGAPEYNLRAFTADGFYRSGDLMRQHPTGNYIVEGRKKDLINRGGEKISAEEIENLILSHPAVKNVACVPVADAVMGERMCACVMLRESETLSFEELKQFLLTKEIAKFKLPERLETFDEFPLSTFGKVSKNRLVEIVSAKMLDERQLQSRV